MSNAMRHKRYQARIDVDGSDGIFTVGLAGIRNRAGFHSDTVECLREAFHEAVEDYRDTRAKIGKAPQRAYSGQMMYPR